MRKRQGRHGAAPVVTIRENGTDPTGTVIATLAAPATITACQRRQHVHRARQYGAGCEHNLLASG
ncbi:MAG: hypothetical protein OXF25_04720 [Cyanobacteria bacterium MAG CAR3_bin_5]|nr:hypothetical protein [Cyanobacteria bacterium MAG CAR3_bin_5]